MDAFGALARGGECAAARYVREVRRPGDRPAGDAGTESARQEGRACHGTRPPSPGQPRGKRRGDGGRSCPGKLLAAPIRGLARRFYPSQPRSGIVTFRRTATEGVALPLPPGDYWHGRPGGRLHGRGQEGRAATCTEGPEADSAFEALGNASAEGPEILWPKGAPLSPSRRVQRSQRGRRNGPVGAGRLAVACTSVCKLSLFNVFGAVAGGQVLWHDHRLRPPSYIVSG